MDVWGPDLYLLQRHRIVNIIARFDIRGRQNSKMKVVFHRVADDVYRAIAKQRRCTVHTIDDGFSQGCRPTAETQISHYIRNISWGKYIFFFYCRWKLSSHYSFIRPLNKPKNIECSQGLRTRKDPKLCVFLLHVFWKQPSEVNIEWSGNETLFRGFSSVLAPSSQHRTFKSMRRKGLPLMG